MAKKQQEEKVELDLPKLKEQETKEKKSKKKEEINTESPKIEETKSDKKEEIKLKPIQLEVKEKKSKKDNKKTEIDEETVFKFTSTINIILVVILLLASVMLIINIVKEVDKKGPEDVIEIEEPKKEIIIYGNYQTTNDSLFTFKEDNTFYWFDNYNVLDNNYYSGTYTYTRGAEALNEMGYTEEELLSIFGEIELNNIYSIEMTPTKVYKNNRDITNKELKHNKKWWYILVLKDGDNATGYNKTIDARYTLKRK